MNNNKVTWIMPVLNGMPFIRETLAALSATSSSISEIIVWDNGSTDGTLEELGEWIPSKIRGRVISDNPLDLSSSLNALVCVAQTEFCARIDADDIPLPGRLERQLEFLRNNPKVAVVGGQMIAIDSNGDEINIALSYPVEHEEIIIQLLAGKNPIPHPGVVFRRKTVLDAGNYCKGHKVEDYDLWLRLAAISRLANLPDHVTRYRLHEKSYTQQAIKKRVLGQRMEQTLQEHASELFGWDSVRMANFQNREVNFALPLWFQLKIPTWNQNSQSPRYREDVLDLFLDHCHNRDLISKLYFASLHPRRGTFRREIRMSASKILGLLPPWRKWRERLYQEKLNQNVENWFKSHHDKGLSMDRSVRFKGKSDVNACLVYGQDCLIEEDVCFWLSDEVHPAPRLKLGKRIFLGRGTYVGVHEPVEIGDHTIIGAYCYIISANHRADRRDQPIRDQGFVGAPVSIGSDVWIGTHVVILPGVTIGEGAIIGAGSVVTKSIPSFQIWAGVPARYIKDRP